MGLQYFRRYFTEKRKTDISDRGIVTLYYVHRHFGRTLELSLNSYNLFSNLEGGPEPIVLSIVIPCLPKDIVKTKAYIDYISALTWNEIGEPIKEDLLNYLRKLHRVDGEMTKAAR
tara:strand:- start:686 stop:1033 length:348 start_codon:yes stop_codon:yes gene_type:complete